MSKSTSTSQTIDPAQRSAIEAVWAKAQEVAGKPYEAYGGQLVAGANPYQTAGWDMAGQGALNGVGDATMNAALAAMQGASQYKPLQVSAPTASLGMPSIYAGAEMGPTALAGAAPTVSATSYGGASLNPVTQAAVERLGNATQANAATVDRSGVRDIASEQGLQYLQSYMNPYENQVVQNTLSDLDRSRQMALINGEDAALRAGGYGGSRHGVADSLTNEASLRQAADTAGQLRMAGFNTAAQLGQTDAARALQAAAANQGADLSAMTTNAGNLQQTNLANAAAQNQYGLANATFGNQANQFNAGAANEQTIAQGNLANTAGIASMQAANQAAMASAQMAQQQQLANQAAKNQMMLAQAQMAQQAGLAGADAKNQFALQGAGWDLQSQLANQNAGFQAANLGLSSGQSLANLSDQQRAQYFQNAAALEAAGGAQQGQEQRGLDSAYQQWLQQQNYPYQQLQALSGGLPSTYGTTVTQNPSQAGSIGQGVNVIGSLLGLLGQP